MDDNPTPAQPSPMPAAFRWPMPGHNAFVPVLLLSLALSGWLGFQGWQLFNERQQLQQFAAGLEAPVNNANRLRASLDRLALATRQLASEGNPNARLLVDELQRRGVTINPERAAGALAPPAK